MNIVHRSESVNLSHHHHRHHHQGMGLWVKREGYIIIYVGVGVPNLYIMQPFRFTYSPFHETLLRSSAFVNWTSLRFHGTDCILGLTCMHSMPERNIFS